MSQEKLLQYLVLVQFCLTRYFASIPANNGPVRPHGWHHLSSSEFLFIPISKTGTCVMICCCGNPTVLLLQSELSIPTCADTFQTIHTKLCRLEATQILCAACYTLMHPPIHITPSIKEKGTSTSVWKLNSLRRSRQEFLNNGRKIQQICRSPQRVESVKLSPLYALILRTVRVESFSQVQWTSSSNPTVFHSLNTDPYVLRWWTYRQRLCFSRP